MILVAFIFGACITWLWLRNKPRDRKHFHCPSCGGEFWGSTTPFETGSCATCNFRWNRKDDDLYFY